MDDDKESKDKNTLLSGFGSSIFNIFNKLSSASNNNVINEKVHSNFSLNNKQLMMELDKSEDNNADKSLNIKKKIDINKRKYTEVLTNEFQKEKSKRVITNDINDPCVKRVKLNNSFNNSAALNDTFNSQFIKPNNSYRWIANNQERKITNDFHKDIFSRSASIQSLSESMDETYQSATASRISHNLFSQQKISTNSVNITSNNLSQSLTAPYSMNSRRFKTVVKRDKISSYLSRENISNNDSIFSPATITAPLTFSLTPNKDESVFRFDLSQLRKTPSDNINTVENWNCDQCDTINPIHFNFCPSCSNANPINKINKGPEKTAIRKMDNNSWKCYRCFTINGNDKSCCVCCFLAKDIRPIQTDTDAEMINDEHTNANLENGNPKKFVFKSQFLTKTNKSLNSFQNIKYGGTIESNRNETTVDGSMLERNNGQSFELPSDSKLKQISFGDITKPIPNDSNEDLLSNKTSIRKWECPSCMVENMFNAEVCVCCSTKNTNLSTPKSNPIKFGNTESNPSFKFGSSAKKEASKWECPSCMVENVLGTDACVCCCTKNPKSITVNSVKFGNSDSNESFKFGSSEKKEAAKWECPSCMVDNVLESYACVCCSTKNPKSKTDNSIKFGFKDSNETFKFGSSDKKKSTKWECPSCMVENVLDTEACVCCCTKNPKSITVNVVRFDNSDSNKAFKFGSFNKKEATKWECPSCMVENMFNAEVCVCCSTKNTNLSTPKSNPIKFGNADSNPSFKFGSSAKKEEPKWECPSCMVENVLGTDTCVCCCTKNLSSNTVNVVKFDNGQSNKSFKFGSSDQIGATTWECPSCMVENVSSMDNCPCCTTRNPMKSSRTMTEVDLDKDDQTTTKNPAIVSESVIKFDSSSEKKTFQFGTVDKTIPKSTVTFGSSMHTVVTSPQTFSFGTDTKVTPNTSTEVQKWICPSCLVENEAHARECPCCSTKNPKSLSLFTNPSQSSTVAPTFSFGKLHNGLDGNKGVQEIESLNFSFSSPEVLPFDSKMELMADIEFVFSSADKI